MRGYANERGLSSLAEGSFARRQDAGSVSLAPRREGARGLEARRTPLRAARRTLDGIGGLGWSVIGFLFGAVFWHFVGFWSFVSEVVLAGHALPSEQSRSAGARHATFQTAESPYDAALAVAWCTSLVLDRRTGATAARDCAGEAALASARGVKQREDRAAAADGGAWVAPSTPARVLGRPRP